MDEMQKKYSVLASIPKSKVILSRHLQFDD